MSAGPRRRWHVDCRDAMHADRNLTVLVNRDKVALVGTPGDAAVLSAEQAGQLSWALRHAAAQARR